MACFNPLLAVDNGVNSDTGKHSIKILNMSKYLNFENARSVFGDSLLMLPCGHCVGCAQDYARMWQARIMAEALYHEKKCFLTLTYKDAPASPSKKDLREFIKELRNKFGKGIKFFGCGEKGEITERSHYHLILFGVDFSEDRIPIQKRGLNIIYRSPILESLWSYGFSSIGSLDVASAGYVSKYCNKKKINSLDNGEFVIMSRGLGRRYFEENNVFDSDFLYFEGNKFKLPRYFLKLAENGDLGQLVDMWNYKDRKRERAQGFRYGSNKSFEIEELSMLDDKQIKENYLKSKEVFRDVIY